MGVLQAYASLLGVALWKGHSAAAASYGFSANNVWVAILNTLAFSTPALPRLYAYVTANVKVGPLPTHRLNDLLVACTNSRLLSIMLRRRAPRR